MENGIPTKMICRRGDYVTLNTGERCRVIHGTSNPNGLVVVYGMCLDGHTRELCKWASDIVKVEKRQR